MLPLVLSSASHVFNRPICGRPAQRVDLADQIVVEAGQVLSGIGLISNAGAGSKAARPSPPKGASKTCTAAGKIIR